MSSRMGKYLIKGEYSVEVSGSDGKKVFWEVKNNHIFEYSNDNYGIGLLCLVLNF